MRRRLRDRETVNVNDIFPDYLQIYSTTSQRYVVPQHARFRWLATEPWCRRRGRLLCHDSSLSTTCSRPCQSLFAGPTITTTHLKLPIISFNFGGFTIAGNVAAPSDGQFVSGTAKSAVWGSHKPPRYSPDHGKPKILFTYSPGVDISPSTAPSGLRTPGPFLGSLLHSPQNQAKPARMYQIGNIYGITAIAVIGGGLFGFDISSMSAM